MARRMTTILGTFAALSMVVAAMWAWNDARRLAEGSARPDVTLWAVRSAAVALVAAAQAMILTWVVSLIYRRDLVGDVLRLFAALIAAIALISAVALGLAGR
ncbi:MAG TPA: hypothetical protein VHS31_04455 [Tepidisphaeraceae bacterium]|jgi:hypothetical protein|nr:hypothetical protein [Tepidisphaeraceae bacterium]